MFVLLSSLRLNALLEIPLHSTCPPISSPALSLGGSIGLILRVPGASRDPAATEAVPTFYKVAAIYSQQLRANNASCVCFHKGWSSIAIAQRHASLSIAL
jgi:hypothetical protein